MNDASCDARNPEADDSPTTSKPTPSPRPESPTNALAMSVVPSAGTPLAQSGLPTLLAERYATANTEMLFRIGHRDQWILYHLIAQGSLLALKTGIGTGIVQASGPISLVGYFAMPLSFIFATYYTVEDRLISLCVLNIRKLLTGREHVRRKPESLWAVWREADGTTLRERTKAQVVTFVIVPILSNILQIKIKNEVISNVCWTAVFSVLILRVIRGALYQRVCDDSADRRRLDRIDMPQT